MSRPTNWDLSIQKLIICTASPAFADLLTSFPQTPLQTHSTGLEGGRDSPRRLWSRRAGVPGVRVVGQRCRGPPASAAPDRDAAAGVPCAWQPQVAGRSKFRGISFNPLNLKPDPWKTPGDGGHLSTSRGDAAVGVVCARRSREHGECVLSELTPPTPLLASSPRCGEDGWAVSPCGWSGTVCRTSAPAPS